MDEKVCINSMPFSRKTWKSIHKINVLFESIIKNLVFKDGVCRRNTIVTPLQQIDIDM